MVGLTISQYRNLDKIGEGARIVVSKAEGALLRWTVAPKFLFRPALSL